MYMFLRRSLARINYMYMIYFLSVHLGVLPHPPPPQSCLRYCHLDTISERSNLANNHHSLRTERYVAATRHFTDIGPVSYKVTN